MIDCSGIIKDQGVPDDLVRTVIMAANCAFEIGRLRRSESKKLKILMYSSPLFVVNKEVVAKDSDSYPLFDFGEKEVCSSEKVELGADYGVWSQKIRLVIPTLKKSKRLRRLTLEQALSFVTGHEVEHHIQNVRGEPEVQKLFSIYTQIREDVNMGVLEREANRMGSLVIRRLYGVDFNLHYT